MGQKRLPRLPPGTPQSNSPRAREPPRTPAAGDGALPSLTPRSPRSPRSSRSSRGSSGQREPGSFARHQGDAGDTTRSRPDLNGTRSPRSRRAVEIPVVAQRQTDTHPLGAYAESPRAATNTIMRVARRERDRPHPSMDVDGDGTISQFDFKLANRFDDDGNGILDEEETANLRAMMAKQNVKDIAKMMGAAKKTDLDFEKIKGQILGDRPTDSQSHSISGEEVMLMRSAFDALDNDLSGKVDASELGTLSAELGKPMSKEEVVEVLTEIDADHSGQVDFSEFKAYWTKCKQKAVASGEHSKVFGGLDLGSDDFRKKIEQMAANARKMNQIYASSGTRNVMDQTQIVAPAGSVPGKIYGEHIDDKDTYLREVHMQRGGEDLVTNSLDRDRPHANLGPVTKMENGVLYEVEGDAQGSTRDNSPPPEAVRNQTPELWTKGSDVFRMVAAKIESKTANVAKLFRQFDLDGDGTVDYRELRTGLKNMGVELPDDKFKELCELIDEDRSGDIDYQEFANADVMGSRLFKARNVQGHSGVPTVTQLHYKRGLKNRTFAHYRTNQHYETYMHGGREGYFGARSDVSDQSMETVTPKMAAVRAVPEPPVLPTHCAAPHV
jgi:Ca2+-binding EF-hand superfamily protein